MNFAAFAIRVFCSSEQEEISSSSSLYRASGRLRSTPVLEHGASSKTRLKRVGSPRFSSSPAREPDTRSEAMEWDFIKSILDRFSESFSILGPGRSTDTSREFEHADLSKPAERSTRSAHMRDFPPGAAHRSRIDSPVFGFKSSGAKEVDGSCA